MAEAEKDDWLDELDTPEEKASALDPSDLDALLSDSFDSGKPAAEAAPSEGDNAELDQSAIDAMFSGPGETLKTLAPQQAAAGENNDLDQSDIDTLLASPKNPIKDQSATDPDQDEIDKLFSEADSDGTAEENPFQAEEGAFNAVDSPTASSPKSVNLDFNAEEFKLDDDIPDIPDTKPQGFGQGASLFMDEDTVAAPPPSSPPPERLQTETTGTSEMQAITTSGFSFLHNRKLLMGIGAGLSILLIAGGVVYFMKGGAQSLHKQAAPEVAVQHEVSPPEPAVQEHEPAAATPTPHEQPTPETTPVQQHHENAAPTVKDLDLTMPPESSQLAITLSGSDPENEALLYVMSLPENGHLTGHAPNLIYTPKPDFNGQDGFIVMATDGKNPSAPATVKITRQPPSPAHDSHPPPAEAAKTADTKPAEAAPPEHQGEVAPHVQEKSKVILAKNKLGRLSSKAMAVHRKKMGPSIHLQPIAPSYETGDTVIINASQSKDDSRSSLVFHWEQLAGAPVLIKPLNSEGSQIAFVVPATFSTVANPFLLLKVTATDQEGERDSKEIRVTTKSRRTSAIWRGQD